LETTGQDWANHLSHEVSGNGTMYFAALLSQKPDAEILRQASEDLIALEPVLGCRFDDTRETPVWVSSDDADWFTQAEAEDLRQGLDAFIRDNSGQGRQMAVRLIASPGQAALVLRLDHSAIDGGGAKGCLALLSQCYNQRLAGGKAPESTLADRSDGRVFARCGVPDFRMALRRETSAPGPVATVPYAGMDERTVRYRWISLPLSAVRRSGCTVNDCLIAAFSLAVANGEAPVSIHMTVDLRRFLDGNPAPIACNLSGMEAVNVGFPPQESFADTLADVHRQTALLKSNHPGLSSAAMMAYLRTMPYVKVKEALIAASGKSRLSGTAAPILSNLGLVFKGTMHFGDAVVTDILPLLPAMHAPAFMLGAGSYLDVLTLSAGFYAEERQADEVERLLLDIREKLLQNAM
jgi:NRPS condensation-like uncharacterized protein